MFFHTVKMTSYCCDFVFGMCVIIKGFFLSIFSEVWCFTFFRKILHFLKPRLTPWKQTAGISFRAFYKLGTETLPLGLEMLISKLIFPNATDFLEISAAISPSESCRIESRRHGSSMIGCYKKWDFLISISSPKGKVSVPSL